MNIKNCLVCNKEFKHYFSDKRKYCSYKCSVFKRSVDVKKYYQTHSSWWLGKKHSEITKRKISLAHKGKKFSKEHKKNLSIARTGAIGLRGSLNPNWKGGRKIDINGYIWVLSLNHPFASKNYVKEHRLMMEKYLGRYLKSAEVVHHINGNPSDNRLTNLLLLPNNTEHLHLHKNKLRGSLSKCAICKRKMIIRNLKYNSCMTCYMKILKQKKERSLYVV